jgi:hypothetical protein
MCRQNASPEVAKSSAVFASGSRYQGGYRSRRNNSRIDYKDLVVSELSLRRRGSRAMVIF